MLSKLHTSITAAGYRGGSVLGVVDVGRVAHPAHLLLVLVVPGVGHLGGDVSWILNGSGLKDLSN